VNKDQTMSLRQFNTLELAVKNRIALVTLARPDSMNAISEEMRKELLSVLQWIRDDDDIRVMVLTGKGRAFCVGHDLRDPSNEPAMTQTVIEEEYAPVILALNEMNKPVIAAVNGPAAGGGAALAMACDLVIMGADAYLYQAFLAIGLIPDCGASWFLLHQLGYRRAFEAFVDGSKLGPQECVALGLANRTAAQPDLLPDAMAWAGELAEKAPLAVRFSKSALKYAQHHTLADTIGYEAKIQGKLCLSNDAWEGATAFLEKRKPNFTAT